MREFIIWDYFGYVERGWKYSGQYQDVVREGEPLCNFGFFLLIFQGEVKTVKGLKFPYIDVLFLVFLDKFCQAYEYLADEIEYMIRSFLNEKFGEDMEKKLELLTYCKELLADEDDQLNIDE